MVANSVSAKRSAAGRSRARRGPRRGASAALLALLAGMLFPVAVGAQSDGAAADEIVAAVPAHWPPQYSTDVDGRPAGFAIDVIEAVARRAGLHVVYRVGRTWADVQRMLKDGEVDIIPELGRTPARERWAAFTSPVETFRISLFVRASTDDIRGLGDLAGRPVAVVRSNAARRRLEGRPGLRLRIFPQFEEALFALLSGQVDAFAFPEPVLTAAAATIGVGQRIKTVGEPLAEVKRAVAVRPDRPDLLRRLEAAVADFVGSPEYLAVYAAWFGRPKPFWLRPAVLWVAGAAALLLVVAMGGWRHLSVMRLNRRLLSAVHERQAALRELRAAERRLHDLIAGSKLPILITNREGRRLMVNRAFADLAGYDRPDDLVAAPRGAFVAPEDWDHVWRHHCALLAGEDLPASYEFEGVRKDGGRLYIQAVTHRIVWDGEDAVQHTLVDLTAQRRAEAARRLSEEQFRTAFEAGGAGMMMTGASGRYQRVNKAFCNFLGRTEAEIVGRRIGDFSHPDDLAEVRERLRRFFREPRPNFAIEKRFVRKDGATVWGLLNIAAVRDADGAVRHLITNVQDITERRRAEQALRESEARLAHAQRLASVGNWERDLATDRLFWSDQVYRIFGLSPADFQVTRDGFLARVHADDRPAVAQAMHAAIEAGAPYEVDHRIVRPDGEVRIVHQQGELVRDGDGRPLRFVGAIQDVTELRRAETELARKTEFLDLVRATASAANQAADFAEALRFSIERIRAFTGCALGHAYLRSAARPEVLEPSAIWSMDDVARCRPFVEMTGTCEFVAGRGLPGRVVAAGAPLWSPTLPCSAGAPAVRGNVATQVGFRSAFALPVVTGNETVAVLEFFSCDPLARDEALLEVLTQVGTQLGRVYEREKAERELRHRERQLRQIIDHVPHHIFVKDRDGRFLLANQAVADAYGVAVDDLIGRDQRTLHEDAAVADAFLADDREVIESGCAKIFSTEFVNRSNGETRLLRTLKMPYTTESGEGAVLGIAVDITEERRAEEKLRQAQKMEALGQTTGGLAHDFNNLLTIILGNLQLLQRRLDDESLLALASTAEAAARRGAVVTRRLLAFARGQPLQPVATDLNRMVADMAGLVSRSLAVDADLEYDLADGLWSALVDPVQVENALLNLVINGRDALGGAGTIRIATANVEVRRPLAVINGELGPGGYVVLEVRDTGTGMAKEVRERAIEPFFTTKAVGRGSGLGLSMIYGFVRQSGGGMTIDSAPGQGTTVRLYLPRSADDVDVGRRAAAEPARPAPGAMETVLLVEDDPDVRAFAAAVLDGLDYRIVEAADARTALEVLDGDTPVDLLFTDIVLPGGMDGHGLAKAARRRRPGLDVLFTSGGWDFRGDEPSPDDDGEARILQKPYTQNELAAMIRGILDNRQQRHEGTGNDGPTARYR